MRRNDKRVAGSLLFVGGAQFILGMTIAETLYPGYSVSANYISDLGVGSTALLFNSSVFLLGVLALISAYFIQRAFNYKLLSVCLALTGIGAMGVGLFPENVKIVHTVASLITFLFGALSAITSCKLQKKPLSYFAVLLGIMSLAALALFISGNYLGLDKGGMERMIAYPTLLWAIGFGGHLSYPEI